MDKLLGAAKEQAHQRFVLQSRPGSPTIQAAARVFAERSVMSAYASVLELRKDYPSVPLYSEVVEPVRSLDAATAVTLTRLLDRIQKHGRFLAEEQLRRTQKLFRARMTAILTDCGVSEVTAAAIVDSVLE